MIKNRDELKEIRDVWEQGGITSVNDLIDTLDLLFRENELLKLDIEEAYKRGFEMGSGD